MQHNTKTCSGRLWNFLCNFIAVTLKVLPIEIQHFFRDVIMYVDFVPNLQSSRIKKTRIFFRCQQPSNRYLGSCSQLYDCSWTRWEQSSLETWGYFTRSRKCSQANCPRDNRDLRQWDVEGACKWESASQDWPRQILTRVFFRWNDTLGWGYRKGKE